MIRQRTPALILMLLLVAAIVEASLGVAGWIIIVTALLGVLLFAALRPGGPRGRR